MLYSRNFTLLTNEEEQEYKDILKQESPGRNPNSRFHKKEINQYPKVLRHYMSLFPNNYLDQSDLILRGDDLLNQCEEYLALIDQPATEELDVKRWIKNNEAYHLIGSILSSYDFGHHGAYLFSEFPITTSLKADYLLIGLNSDGYHFIFCEFESINSSNNEKVIKKDGRFGGKIEKGISQIEQWKTYLQSYYANLENDFLKYKNPNQDDLSHEFRHYDSGRIFFVEVVGRRSDFLPRSRELRIQCARERNIRILHYDNLYDNLRKTINRSTY